VKRALLFCVLVACTPPAHPARDGRPGDVLLREQFELTPDLARGAGLHEWDHRLADYSAAGIANRIQALHERKKRIAAMRPADPEDAMDLALLDWNADEQLFWLETRNVARTDPAFYDELFSVHGYIDREYADYDARVHALVEHEEAALKRVAHVRENLRPPLPKPLVDVGIGIYKGYASYLRKDVAEFGAKSRDPAFKTRFDAANTALAGEAEKLASWLATVSTNEDYSLGAANFQRLVDIYAGQHIPLADFEKTGRENLARDQKLYDELAPKVPQPSRPTAANLVATAQALTEDARKFITEHHIVSMPSAERAIVVETPPYLRYNAAWLDAPGPFDPPLGAFFYVTPPDPSWSVERRTEYIPLTSELRATSTHEVYPGHFVQYTFLRRAPTMTQKVISSATFVEGWAHYAEQMMAEEGFSADPENHLGQVTEALLRDCRYLVALAVHTQGQTLAQAEKRFVEECHQTSAVAKEQSVRAALHPWYFAYTLGKLQILALREEVKRAPDYRLQRFHDALLSHGQGPVGLIRPRVLRDLGLP
jgi:hypothetical protein